MRGGMNLLESLRRGRYMQPVRSGGTERQTYWSRDGEARHLGLHGEAGERASYHGPGPYSDQLRLTQSRSSITRCAQRHQTTSSTVRTDTTKCLHISPSEQQCSPSRPCFCSV